MPHEQLPHASWRKSSRSGEQGACVEVASLGAMTAIRDSKHPDRGALVVDRATLAGLAERIKAGAFDL